MSLLTADQLTSTLTAVGLRPGDVVMAHTDLLRCGPVDAANSRDDILRFYFDRFMSVLGPDGTLVVLTSYDDYGRLGKPFDRRHSPSTVGAFSEHVRGMDGAVRSMHPAMSLTAVGARAEEICGGPHYEGFGASSPWARLVASDARIVTLGYGVTAHGMTFLHYLERVYGVPYRYIKIFDHPVLDDGVPVDGTFTLAVRYLDLDIETDQRAMKQLLLDGGHARLMPLGRGEIFATTCRDVLDVGLPALDQDRYFLLKRPPVFREGRIPTV